MKSFRQIFSEVAEPKGGDEKAFKDKHIVTKVDYPVDVDDQFTGGKTVKKAPKRKADLEAGEDEMVYEASLDAVDPKELKGSHKDRKDKDIDNDGDIDSSDEYLHNRRKAISKAMKKEEVELDEANMAENWQEEVPMMQRQLYFMAYAAEEIMEWLDSGVDPEEWFQNKMAAMHGNMQSLYSYVAGEKKMMSAEADMWEETKLEEGIDQKAYKAGIVKLKDGSSIILKKEDATLMNKMMKDLSSTNRKKMESVAMKDKAGFEEILGFAREAL